MTDRIRVLIAEDQKIISDNLSRMLKKEADIDVVAVAASGAEAVEKAIVTKPEIILMDVEMESADAGIIAAEEINEILPETKIIFLTVHQDDSTVITALNAGAVDYLVKTADCKKAIDHIREAHSDTVRMEAEIQKIMHTEYMKLAHEANDNLSFIKRLMQLTVSEREIIALLLEGRKTREIAEMRYVETATIKKQIGTILHKCGLKRTRELCEIIRALQITSLFTP